MQQTSFSQAEGWGGGGGCFSDAVPKQVTWYKSSELQFKDFSQHLGFYDVVNVAVKLNL